MRLTDRFVILSVQQTSRHILIFPIQTQKIPLSFTLFRRFASEFEKLKLELNTSYTHTHKELLRYIKLYVCPILL